MCQQILGLRPIVFFEKGHAKATRSFDPKGAKSAGKKTQKLPSDRLPKSSI
jgi:hypothetical protein